MELRLLVNICERVVLSLVKWRATWMNVTYACRTFILGSL